MAPTPAVPPSNALWLTFIGAWRDEARERGSKAAQTFNKAYRSLAACPIPFQHPCQTTQLVGIGPTIASRLEQELQKWCDENGETMPERPTVSAGGSARKTAKAAATSKATKTTSKADGRGAQQAVNGGDDGDQGRDGGAGDDGDDDDDDDDDSSSNGDGDGAGAAAAGTKRSNAAKPKAAAKKPRAPSKKAYVPQLRSGAYGLMLGLFSRTHSGVGGEEVYLSKDELIQASQPYSDSDYVNGGGGGSRSVISASIALPHSSQAPSSRTAPKSYYSAWNSMKTLITKGYVYQTGNPPKFCLSEQGFTVAATMAHEAGVKQADGAGRGDSSSILIDEAPPPKPGPSRLAPARRSAAASADEAGPPTRSSGPPAFRYAYLLDGEASRLVLSRSDAAQRPSRSGAETCYRIRFPRSMSGHETAAHFVELIEEDESADDMLTGYLREAKADPVAPGLKGSTDPVPKPASYPVLDPAPDVAPRPTTKPASGHAVESDRPVAARFEETLSDDDIEAELARLVEGKASAAGTSKMGPQRRVPRLSSIIPAPGAESSWHSRLLPPPRTSSNQSVTPGSVGGSGSGSESTTAPELQPKASGNQESNGDDDSDADGDAGGLVADVQLAEPDEVTVAAEESLLAPTKGAPPAIPAFDPIKMPRGSFTIHFILDNRERRHSRDVRGKVSLAGALEAKGVAVEVRALELGDAIWIARRKGGGGAEGDEVVLDFVVERKRLDDLTSSILDGRWKDQKFRLSSSGLSQVVYLIEDYDVDNQMRRFGEQIQTALSSTQVVDGFFVERTAGLDASIDHLARMDRIVREMYGEAELTILPDAVVSRSTYTQLQGELRAARPDVTYLTTFAAYQSLNGKSASLTLRDVFGKMLLCVRGMSAEKVREVLELWQTPRELWEAYEAIESGAGSSDAGGDGGAGGGGGGQRGSKGGAGSKRSGKGAGAGGHDAATAAGATLLSSRVNPPEQRKKIGAALSAKTHAVFRSRSYAA
ncbi:uncharacterized protein PFL1_01421 [Pseudozyma flocculosa PF-1]|uniref:Crossover junction endonuclease MUS81 n=1 Tax=Pseudozyma flocculosa TaxID=84751 RepID=A0A5C3EXZ8_9BASI|nr:uncharacterized protein PFL1_01421 [Pseudozyma flocculosa PF-1]EPQ31236.1 hypothetical protein PFL1_01421 [Pseudozyma flocculosa PF-1]SPO36267.1 uncharacterized protein PSFLO_01738 [Pseudozyma flocculosa]